jgi:hypothetical protein
MKTDHALDYFLQQGILASPFLLSLWRLWPSGLEWASSCTSEWHFKDLAVKGICAFRVHRNKKSEEAIQLMMWKVKYEDIDFAKGKTGSMVIITVPVYLYICFV